MAEIINLDSYRPDCRNCLYHTEQGGGACTYPGGWEWDTRRNRCVTFLWRYPRHPSGASAGRGQPCEKGGELDAGVFAAAGFLTCFVLIFLLRMPIPTGMLTACLAYFLVDGALSGQNLGSMLMGQSGNMHIVAQKAIEQIFTNNVLIAIPLFIFAANIMNAGKITEYVFGACKGLVDRFPGGLAYVNVLASLVFSGMTGSAVADASGLGKMEIDAMRKEDYDDGFSCAITAAFATIGPIFPPSIPMVIYAMLTSASVGALVSAGMVPGLLLAIALCIYVFFISKKRNYPKDTPSVLGVYLRYLAHALPAILTPVILLIGIYTGVMTPTEAGAIAALYALLLAVFGYRILKWDGLKAVLVETVKTTGSVSIMVGAAAGISFIFAKEHLGVLLGNWLLSVTANKYVFLLLGNIVILILGMFVDINVVQLVMIPIFWPVAEALDIHVIHFGLILSFNMMIGLSTPTFGMCLFITSGISGTPLKRVFKEIIPLILIMIIVLLIITYIPEVVMFLPRVMGLL